MSPTAPCSSYGDVRPQCRHVPALTTRAGGSYSATVTKPRRILRTPIALLSGMMFGCFVSDPLNGAPCTEDSQCGDDLRCMDGFCKPASCAAEPKCSPFKAPCARGDNQRCGAYGSHGCFYAKEEEMAGYCAYTCEMAEQCPNGSEGSSAAPTCARAEIDYEDDGRNKSEVVGFCVLDCSSNKTCPSDMHCVDVKLFDGPPAICFSGPPPSG